MRGLDKHPRGRGGGANYSQIALDCRRVVIRSAREAHAAQIVCLGGTATSAHDTPEKENPPSSSKEAVAGGKVRDDQWSNEVERKLLSIVAFYNVGSGCSFFDNRLAQADMCRCGSSARFPERTGFDIGDNRVVV